MTINHWVISDTHFGHDRLIKLGHRPEKYNELLLENLSVIKENDILYHLGDFSFYNHEKWVELFFSNCKARKNILIKGNHDRETYTWYYNHGWDTVCEELTLKMYGSFIVMTHEPLHLWDIGIGLNIHGHVHNTNHRNSELTDCHRPVIMEHGYKPLLLKDLVCKN